MNFQLILSEEETARRKKKEEDQKIFAASNKLLREWRDSDPEIDEAWRTLPSRMQAHVRETFIEQARGQL